MISSFCAEDKDGLSVEDGAIIDGVDVGSSAVLGIVIPTYREASSEETVRGSLAFCDGSKPDPGRMTPNPSGLAINLENILRGGGDLTCRYEIINLILGR